jgi:hypothetical protein
MDSCLSSRNHPDAFLRTYLDADAAAVAFFMFDNQHLVRHRPGAETTGVGANLAIGAIASVGVFDQLSPVAFLFGVEKIPAAIVAAKTDAVGLAAIVIIPKRPRHQARGIRLPEYRLDLVPTDLVKAGTGAAEFMVEHQAYVHSGAPAVTFLFAATAVRHPKPVMAFDQLSRFLFGAYIVKRNLAVAHRILQLSMAAYRVESMTSSDAVLLIGIYDMDYDHATFA